MEIPCGLLLLAGGGTDNVNGMEVRGRQLFMTGEFTLTIDLDASAVADAHTYAGFTDIFFTAYSTEGDFLWGHAFGSSSSEFSHDLAIGPEGQVYLTGNFWNTVDFSTTGGTTSVTSNAQSDIFLAAFSTTGDDLWVISAGGSDAEEGLAVGAGSGGPVITGTFGSIVDFDPGPDELEISSAGFYEIYLARYTTEGALIEATSFPSAYSCYGQAIEVAANNDLITGGRFSLAVDMDPGPGASSLTGGGGFSGYVARYSTCTSYDFSDTASICAGESYEFQGSLLDTAGWYTISYITEEGCDSTFNLLLNVQVIDTAIVATGTVLTAVLDADYTYQWQDCLDGLSPIPGATSHEFTATESGSYALEIVSGSCSAITECFPIEITTTGNAYQPVAMECIYLEQNTWQLITDQPGTMQVYDAFGRLHQTVVMDVGTTNWSAADLPAGMYLLTGYWGMDRWQKKIIVLE